ncbi:hypothetical protein ABIA33_005128 [Streptacidiphilus sp. MAP12-16]
MLGEAGDDDAGAADVVVRAPGTAAEMPGSGDDALAVAAELIAVAGA